MDLYEDLVLQYLTKDAHIFVNPQYSIKGDKNAEWSCPDFIALNFREKVVSIVEVSSAYNPKGLMDKVRDRDKQWIVRLKDQLQRNRVIDESWKEPKVEVFIRKDARNQFQELANAAPDLEELQNLWNWTRSYLPGDL
jgi:hypothetical protein